MSQNEEKIWEREIDLAKYCVEILVKHRLQLEPLGKWYARTLRGAVNQAYCEEYWTKENFDSAKCEVALIFASATENPDSDQFSDILKRLE